tara:strand:- start:77 stop:481 length:405 start_codon:yes stop_codon:yes gene_type:complete
MPWKSEWVPPQIFFEHAGVTVFHRYKDDELCNGVCRYDFILSSGARCESDQLDWEGDEFDIRELDKKVFPGNPLLEGHPPYLTRDNFPDQSAAAYEAARERWREWHEDEDNLKKRILRDAIDGGVLEPHTGETV